MKFDDLTHAQIAKRFEKSIRAQDIVSKGEARTAAEKCATEAQRLMRLLPSVAEFHLVALLSPAGVTFGLTHSLEGLSGTERDISETVAREYFEKLVGGFGGKA